MTIPKKEPTDINSQNKTDSPIATCPQGIVLYPVRFALKQETLAKIIKGKLKELPPAEHITKSPLHELRRLRQGYVYIYATTPVKDATDSYDGKVKGIWHIYQYTTTADDSNAGTEVSHEATTSFRFQKYGWKSLNKYDVDWKIEKPHITIPINPNISTVWIAYSEFRWPFALCSKLMAKGDDGDKLRKIFMQKVLIGNSEESRESDLTTSIRNLHSSVADFMPSDKDKTGNNSVDFISQLKHTVTGINEQDPMSTLKVEKGNGVIVALQDTVGEILDIANLHYALYSNRLSVLSQYEYPLQTAIWANQLDPVIKSMRYGDAKHNTFSQKMNRLWMNMKDWDSPLPYLSNYGEIEKKDKDKLIADFANQLGVDANKLQSTYLHKKFVEVINKADEQIKNVIIMQCKLIKEENRNDLFPHLKKIIHFIDSETIIHSNYLQYLCYIGTQILKNLNLSIEGQKQTNALLAGLEKLKPAVKPDTVNPQILAIIQTALSGFSTIQSKRKIPIYYLDTFIETFSFQLLNQYSQTLIPNHATTGYARARLEQVATCYGVQFDALTSRTLADQSIELRHYTDTIRMNASTHVTSTSNQSIVTEELSVERSSVQQHLHAGDEHYRRLPNATAWADAGTVLLGWAVVIKTGLGDESVHTNKIGALAENRFFVLGYALTDNLTNTVKFVTDGKLKQMADAAHNGLVQLGVRQGALRNANIVIASGTANASLAKQLFVRSNTLAFIGIGISLASAIDGAIAEDMAKVSSNLLNAAGATALLVAGAEGVSTVAFFWLGAVLILAGIAVGFFVDSDLENWIENGFWGDSGNYWGGYKTGWFSPSWKDDRKEFSKQFNISLKLNTSSKNSQIKKDYAIEMGRLHDMLTPIRISAGKAGTRRVNIRWHGLLTASDCQKLTLCVMCFFVRKSEIPKGLTPENIFRFARRTIPIKVHFSGKGFAYIEIPEIKTTNHFKVPETQRTKSLTKALRIDVVAPHIASTGNQNSVKVIMLDEIL